MLRDTFFNWKIVGMVALVTIQSFFVVSLCPQKLALTSPTSCWCSIGIVLSRTQTTEFVFVLFSLFVAYCDPVLQCCIVRVTDSRVKYTANKSGELNNYIFRSYFKISSWIHLFVIAICMCIATWLVKQLLVKCLLVASIFQELQIFVLQHVHVLWRLISLLTCKL
jgi:hypothetical protein